MLKSGFILMSKYDLYCHFDLKDQINYKNIKRGTLFLFLGFEDSYFKVLYENIICYIPYENPKNDYLSIFRVL